MLATVIQQFSCFFIVDVLNVCHTDAAVVLPRKKWTFQGGNATFVCLRADTYTPTQVVKWLFNNDELLPSQRLNIRLSGYSSELHIVSTVQSDSGMYTCVADVDGKRVSSSAFLTVYCK